MNRKRTAVPRSRAGALAALGGLLLLGGQVLAQAVPASQPMTTDLDEPYIDGSFGFTVSPPRGSQISRERRISGVSDFEIVQFSDGELQQWSLTVRCTTTTRPLDARTIIDGITQLVETRFPDVKVLRGEETRIDAREGVRFEATFSAKGGTWLRQQAVIRTKPTEYFALVFVCSDSFRASAEKLFDKIVASFHIVRTEAMSKRINEALDRGHRLLESVRTGKIKLSDHLIPESHYRFILGGKELGFVRILEIPRAHNKRSGLDIQEMAWLFKEDGTTTNLQHEMRLTDDLSFEEWSNRVYTLTPQTDKQPRRLVYQFDKGGRQDNKLIAAYMAAPNADVYQDRLFDVNANYASAAWYTVLARIVDLRRPELYAFSSYNADQRGMTLRTIELIGPAQVTIAGRPMRVIRLQDSEGLLPPITEIDVDEKGHIVRVSSGPLEMTAAGKQEMEARWSKKVLDAKALAKKFPVTEPRPAERFPDSPAEPAAAPARPPGANHE